MIEAEIADYDLNGATAAAMLSDGRRIEADFLVAADGRNSRARAVAGIDVKEWTYPQVALTMMVRHEFPHDNMSTEWHTRSGPFTLVPLPPRDLTDADVRDIRAAYDAEYTRFYDRPVPGSEVEILSFAVTIAEILSNCKT